MGSDNQDVVVGTLRLPRELHERLRLQAFVERRSRNEIIVEVLQSNLDTKADLEAESKDVTGGKRQQPTRAQRETRPSPAKKAPVQKATSDHAGQPPLQARQQAHRHVVKKRLPSGAGQCACGAVKFGNRWIEPEPVARDTE